MRYSGRDERDTSGRDQRVDRRVGSVGEDVVDQHFGAGGGEGMRDGEPEPWPAPVTRAR